MQAGLSSPGQTSAGQTTPLRLRFMPPDFPAFLTPGFSALRPGSSPGAALRSARTRHPAAPRSGPPRRLPANTRPGAGTYVAARFAERGARAGRGGAGEAGSGGEQGGSRRPAAQTGKWGSSCGRAPWLLREGRAWRGCGRERRKAGGAERGAEGGLGQPLGRSLRTPGREVRPLRGEGQAREPA